MFWRGEKQYASCEKKNTRKNEKNISEFISLLKIDNDDLDFALQNYGKTVNDSGWNEIRLADIDGNGIIDIIDLSYIAYNIENFTYL